MDKFSEEIKLQLLDLSDKKRILFAAITCEKLYPNYVYFSENVKWGDSKLLEEAISLLYTSLFREDLIEKEEIKYFIDRIDGIIPDMDDFSSVMASTALDASLAVHYTLNYLLDKDVEHIINVAIHARDTVDMYVQVKYDLDPNEPNLEYKIAFSPYMVQEMERQRNLVKELKKDNEISDEVIKRLKETDKGEAIINLALIEN